MDRRKTHSLRDRGKLGYVESRKMQKHERGLQECHGSEGHL